MCVGIGAGSAGIARVGKQVGRGPQQLHSSLLLQLSDVVCDLIQKHIGLSPVLAKRGHIPGEFVSERGVGVGEGGKEQESMIVVTSPLCGSDSAHLPVMECPVLVL